MSRSRALIVVAVLVVFFLAGGILIYTSQHHGGQNLIFNVTVTGAKTMKPSALSAHQNDTITINNNTLLSRNQLNILANDLNSRNFLSISDIQTEVVNLLRQGHTQDEVSERLGLHPKVIQRLVRKLFERLET